MEVVDTPATPLPKPILPNSNPPTDVPNKTIDHTIVNPLFPQRLNKEKSISQEEETFDIIEQLKNKQIQIPLFQAMKDVPLYGKALKEVRLKKLGWKKKDL